MTFASSFDVAFTLIFGLGDFSFFIVFFRQFCYLFWNFLETPNTAWKIKSAANFHAWEQY